MANRFYTNESFHLEKNVVNLFAYVTFGAAGAPTLVTAKSKGIYSITKSSTGIYVFQFGSTATQADLYNRILNATVNFDASSNGGTFPAAPFVFITANAVTTTGKVTLAFTNTSGTATNPASTEAIFCEFALSNSSAY